MKNLPKMTMKIIRVLNVFQNLSILYKKIKIIHTKEILDKTMVVHPSLIITINRRQITGSQLVRTEGVMGSGSAAERQNATQRKQDAPSARGARSAGDTRATQLAHNQLSSGSGDLDLNALPDSRQAQPPPNHPLPITWKHNIFAYRTPRRLKPVSRLWLLMRGVIIWTL